MYKYISFVMFVCLMVACNITKSDKIYIYEANKYIGTMTIDKTNSITFIANQNAEKTDCLFYINNFIAEIQKNNGFSMYGPRSLIDPAEVKQVPESDFIPLEENVLYELVAPIKMDDPLFKEALLHQLRFSSCSALTEKEHLLHQK